MYAQTITFGNLLERSTEGFVGRRWVREAVYDFLTAHGPRYVLLLGKWGSGKNSFLKKHTIRYSRFYCSWQSCSAIYCNQKTRARSNQDNSNEKSTWLYSTAFVYD
jgi:hypothetical protein